MEQIEKLDTRSTSKMISFYLMSFFFFAPMGLYSIFKNKIDNKIINGMMIIFYSLSSFIYLLVAFKILKETFLMPATICLIGIDISYSFCTAFSYSTSLY